MSDLPPPPPPAGFPPPPPPGSSTPPPPPGYSSTYGTPSPVAAMRYAGIGARFGALLIDGFIVGLFFVPAIIALRTGPTRITECSVDNEGNITVGEQINALCEVPTGRTIALAVLLALAALAASLLYYGALEGGRRGQTLGKAAVGIRVVDAITGAPIGAGRAIGRYLFKSFISGSVCLLGYLWALWDPRKQSWHDKVVTSVVVKA